MKISKSKIIVVSLFLTVLLIDWNFLSPYVNQKYLESDIRDFESNTLKLLLLKTLIVWIFLNTVYFLSEFKEYIKDFFSLGNFTVMFIYSFFLLFFFNSSCDNFLFYFNTKYNSKQFTEKYVIKSFKPNKVFFIKNNSEVIIYREGLRKIDLQRKKLGLKSIHNFKNNDSITVNYAIG